MNLKQFAKQNPNYDLTVTYLNPSVVADKDGNEVEIITAVVTLVTFSHKENSNMGAVTERKVQASGEGLTRRQAERSAIKEAISRITGA